MSSITRQYMNPQMVDIDGNDGLTYVPTMGRRQINHESRPVRLPAGTMHRIMAVLAPGEKQADLLREAVLREVKRRERMARAAVKAEVQE